MTYGREAQLGLAIGVYGELFVYIFWSPFVFYLVLYTIINRLPTLDPNFWYLWTLPERSFPFSRPSAILGILADARASSFDVD